MIRDLKIEICKEEIKRYENRDMQRTDDSSCEDRDMQRTDDSRCEDRDMQRTDDSRCDGAGKFIIIDSVEEASFYLF